MSAGYAGQSKTSDGYPRFYSAYYAFINDRPYILYTNRCVLCPLVLSCGHLMFKDSPRTEFCALIHVKERPQQLVFASISSRQTKLDGKICPGKLVWTLLCGFGFLTLPERSSLISTSHGQAMPPRRKAPCFLTRIYAKRLSGKGLISSALWSIRCRPSICE